MAYDYLKNNLETLQNEVKKICYNSGRNYDDILIVAVSKTFPSEQINELFKFGHADFGENRVQELVEKKEQLSDVPINWHLIGHLQTNKVKYIVSFVKLIHSVDSVKLASEINRQAEKTDKIVDVLVQVNTSDEMQKSGVEVSEAKNLCNEISSFEKIRMRGLMTIGKFTADEEIIRDNFRTLRNLFDDIKGKYDGFVHLSMGMTSDYKIAIEEGATILRIGSAIFGSR